MILQHSYAILATQDGMWQLVVDGAIVDIFAKRCEADEALEGWVEADRDGEADDAK